MFHLLSEDLLVVLFNDWLSVSLIGLSRLDVACCSRSLRPHWLRVLALQRLQGDKAKYPIHNHLAWLQERMVQLGSISVELAFVNDLDSLPEGTFSFPAITSVQFLPTVYPPRPHGMHRFLSFFPSLRTLVFSKCNVHDHQLMELPGLPLQLSELHLTDCTSISPIAVVAVVSAYQSTLHTLHCDVLDDWSVWKLSRCCSRLRAISWQSCQGLQTETLLAFCESNLMLTHFDVNSPAVTDASMESIANSCAALRVIRLGDTCSVSLALLTTLTANKLCNLMLCGVCLSFQDDPRCCEVVWKDRNSAAQTHALLSLLHAPVWRFVMQSRRSKWVRFNKSSLHLLSNRPTHALKEIELGLEDDVSAADVHQLLINCPSLELLFVQSAQPRSLLEDDIVQSLPRCCPRLREFSFVNSAINLTDQAITAALIGLAQNDITYIHLRSCYLLTDAVLGVIEDCCPHLNTLSLVNSTAITEEALLDFLLIKPKPTLSRLRPPTREATAWIQERTSALGLKVDVRFV